MKRIYLMFLITIAVFLLNNASAADSYTITFDNPPITNDYGWQRYYKSDTYTENGYEINLDYPYVWESMYRMRPDNAYGNGTYFNSVFAAVSNPFLHRLDGQRFDLLSVEVGTSLDYYYNEKTTLRGYRGENPDGSWIQVAEVKLQKLPGQALAHTLGDEWRNLDKVRIGSGYIDNIQVAVAPEPVSSALFLAGAATLGIARIRKKNK